MLEDEQILKEKFGTLDVTKHIKFERNKYNEFCKAYIIHLFKTFVLDSDDVEIMLVAFNYHPEFRQIAQKKRRRNEYARQVYELKHSTGWGDKIEDKDRGLRGKEERIMEELSGILAALVVKNGGVLNLIEDVLETMKSPVVGRNNVDPSTSDDSSVEGLQSDKKQTGSDKNAESPSPENAPPPDTPVEKQQPNEEPVKPDKDGELAPPEGDSPRDTPKEELPNEPQSLPNLTENPPPVLLTEPTESPAGNPVEESQLIEKPINPDDDDSQENSKGGDDRSGMAENFV